ncbi:MAG: hypothetical protein WCF04_13870 [Candidatus Nanopelagicales bacterium]
MKPTTGRVQRGTRPGAGRVQVAPEPDPDQMAADTLITSVITGVALLVAVVVYAGIGSIGLHLLDGFGRWQAMVGLGVGMTLGLVIVILLLRRFADRIQARSRNLYRGIWIGAIAAYVIMGMMYFLPWIAFPQYCPPGAICS